MSGQCWKTRRDVDPRYDPLNDAFSPDPCGHPACEADDCALHEWGCVAVTCLNSRMTSLCTLAAGHDSPCAFDDATVAVLAFPEARL